MFGRARRRFPLGNSKKNWEWQRFIEYVYARMPIYPDLWQMTPKGFSKFLSDWEEFVLAGGIRAGLKFPDYRDYLY